MTSAHVDDRRSIGGGAAARTFTAPLKWARSVVRRDPVLIVAVAALAAVSLFQLGSYPRTWFDEGMYLQTAKNLVTTHTYAVRSADGTLDYAPAVGVGPTLILPVAGVFLLGPMTLEAARLVPVLYLFVATILLYVIARSLFGRLAAALTLVFLVALPSLDWIATGRQVLGEVPAVALLLSGGVVVYGTRSRWTIPAGGLLLGLAMVTKGQYALIIPATVVILAAVDVVMFRRRGVRWFALLLSSIFATYAVWMISLLLIIGGRDLGASYRQLREASGGALLVFNLSRAEAAVRLLVGPSSLLFLVPALLAGLWWIRTADGERRERLLALWTFQVVWLVWFVFASIGWPRYAFPPLALSTIFMGALLAAMIRAVRMHLLKKLGTDRAGVMAAVASAGLIAVVGSGVLHELMPIARPGDTSAEAFARAVEASTSPNATIDGWEPEIGFFLDRKIQYPPGATLNQVVEEEWTSSATKVDLSAELHGEYLIVGPFARWVEVYATAISDGQYQQVLRVGDYQLFKSTALGRAVSHDGGTP